MNDLLHETQTSDTLDHCLLMEAISLINGEQKRYYQITYNFDRHLKIVNLTLTHGIAA